MGSYSPLYIQVKDMIYDDFMKGSEPNDKIPGEYILMDNYNVSRTTIRKALSYLEKDGLLYKKQGLGSFVAEEKVKQSLENYASFSKQMKTMGYGVKYEVLEKGMIQSDADIAGKLNILPGEKIFYLKRKAERNGKVLNYTSTHLPYENVENIESYNFENLSLYSVLENQYDVIITETIRGISAILAREDIAKILEIEEGLPILEFEGFVSGSIKGQKDVIIEYFKTYYRTDDTKFIMHQKTQSL